MSVEISSLAGLVGKAISFRPDVVVSAVPDASELPCRRLRVHIEDIYNAQIETYKAAIRQVLADPGERTLVHCLHGKSRSAALAIAKLYQNDPDSVDGFLDSHPEAEPNPLLLLFADEMLSANGDLLRRCKDRYKGRHL